MKNFFIKIKTWLSNHLPSKRRLIQLYSALLFNANLKGYITGDIFKGISKNLCTPGLNCYSCPGAVNACPLGSLQNALSASEKRTPYYIFGIIMLYGIIFGRWICGWLCPFGLFQDLVYKIKTPKLKKNRFTKVLSYFKYVILVFFVIIVPLAYAVKDFPLPAFCKYICPAGTLGGAIALLVNPENSGMFGMLGPLFTWKFALMVSIIVGCVFIYRLFCRFICPLGALYGIFNKVALFGIKLEKKSCVDCGKCIAVCKMDIRTVGDHECIHCGDCIPVCPTKAISWKGSKIILPDNEIEAVKEDEEALKATEKKRQKRVKIIKIVTASVLALALVGTLVYANFIHKEAELEAVAEGDKCPALDFSVVGEDLTINTEFYQGKVLVINFWGTWCGPCKAELPYFDQIADNYEGMVDVIAVHTVLDKDTAEAYIDTNFPSSNIKWVFDKPIDSTSDYYYKLFGGKGDYPMTVIIDRKGVIQYIIRGSVTYDELTMFIDSLEDN